jgi:hypothetical protein
LADNYFVWMEELNELYELIEECNKKEIIKEENIKRINEESKQELELKLLKLNDLKYKFHDIKKDTRHINKIILETYKMTENFSSNLNKLNYVNENISASLR